MICDVWRFLISTLTVTMPVARSHSTPTTAASPNSGNFCAAAAGLGGATTNSSSNSAATPRKQLFSAMDQESPLVHDDDLAVCKNNNNNNTSSRKQRSNTNAVDLSFTIVWSPLPPITWLIPFIGHTGICDSQGIASDFQGPYYVGDDGRMAFGAPTRYLKLPVVIDTATTVVLPTPSPSSGNVGSNSAPVHTAVTAHRWDEAIQEANEVYRGRMHNICCDNCHSHVANALNRMPISAYGVANSNWDMVKIATLVFFRGHFVSWGAVLQQFLPCTILLALILYLRS